MNGGVALGDHDVVRPPASSRLCRLPPAPATARPSARGRRPHRPALTAAGVSDLLLQPMDSSAEPLGGVAAQDSANTSRTTARWPGPRSAGPAAVVVERPRQEG